MTVAKQMLHTRRMPSPLTVVDLAQARRRWTPRLARKLRQEAGLSRQQLADELGVALSTIERWESGTRRPRAATAARYFELLDGLDRALT